MVMFLFSPSCHTYKAHHHARPRVITAALCVRGQGHYKKSFTVTMRVFSDPLHLLHQSENVHLHRGYVATAGDCYQTKVIDKIQCNNNTSREDSKSENQISNISYKAMRYHK